MDTITKFRNIHKDEKTVIVCNGPSLNNTDISIVNKYIVFCLNRGYLKDGLKFNYFVSIDDLIEDQFRQEFTELECDAKFTNSIDGSYKLKWTPDIPKFSTDISQPIWQGHSVTNVALQIAFYMGCNPVHIVGMDHYINYNNTENKDGKYLNKHEDQNHFDPNYFNSEIKYNHQNLERVELGYSLAYQTYKSHGRELWNSSTFTKLSELIIPKKELT